MTWDKVILIEFNELSPVLLDRFIAAGELPGFRRFRDESVVFTTDAEASQPNLEPWVQWPTVHLGVSHREHGIHHLGDVDDRHRPLGELLSEAGVRVGICGSMNVLHRRVSGFAVPDPWNARAQALPSWLTPFHRTVSSMVQESSREDGSAGGAGLVDFGWLMIKHGLRPATVVKLARQLAEERRDPGVRWRRASALDLLQYDLFRDLVRASGARFATFFSNSTAHYQHYFWRHMDPELFEAPPGAEEHDSLEGAIRYGYRMMDRLLQQFRDDFPDALLVLCTGLSQEPWTDSTKLTYRPRDFHRLLAYAGLERDDVTVEPIMAEEFVVRFASPADAARGEKELARLRVGGQPLLGFVNEGSYLVGGCAISEAGADRLPIERDGVSNGEVLGDMFYPIHTVRSGRHNPDGVLWWRTGTHRVVPDAVKLTAIAPTVLSLLDAKRPDYMAEPLQLA